VLFVPAIRRIVAAVLLLGIAAATSAAPYQRVLPWITGDGLPVDGLGAPMVADGDWMAALAPGDRVWLTSNPLLNNETQRALYLFQRENGTWVRKQRILQPGPNDSFEFGADLAMSGGWLAVGDEQKERVFLYQLDAGQWLARGFVVSSITGERDFGGVLDMEGDVLVVGAPGCYPCATQGVDVFERSGSSWVHRTRLGASSGSWNSVVALSGNSLAFGYRGAVQLWRRAANGSWSSEGFVQPDPPYDDSFPTSLALEGDRLLVGDGEAFDGQPYAGSVYVFDRVGTTWSRRARLRMPQPESQARFGWRVAIAGNDVYATTWNTSYQPAKVARFVPSGNTWVWQSSLVDGQAAGFGASLVVNGSALIVADPGYTTAAGDGAGAMFVIDRASGAMGQVVHNGADNVEATQMAADGDVAVIDFQASGYGVGPGTIDVYRRFGGSWQQVRRIPRGKSERLGPIALCGGQAIVRGATSGLNAYDVNSDSGTPVAHIPPPANASYDFGHRFACAGQTLVVGDPEQNPYRAFFFRRAGNSWSLVTTVFNPGGAQFDYFGATVATSGDRVAVGNANLVHVYAFDGTQFVPDGTVSCGSSYCGSFNSRIAIEGDRIAVKSCDSPGCFQTYVKNGALWQLEATGPPFVTGGPILRDGRLILLNESSGNVDEFVRVGAEWQLVRTFTDRDGTPIRAPAAAIIGTETVLLQRLVVDPRTDNVNRVALVFDEPDRLLSDGFE